MESNRLATLGAIFCVVIWGTTFVVSKDLMSFLTPLQLMFIRFMIAFVALWVVHPVWHFDIRTEWIFILMALFGNFLYFITENEALTITYSSNVSIIASMTTMMSLILTHVLYKDPINGKQIGGFILSIIGVAFVSLNGAFVLELNPVGDGLVLISALCWAIYGLLLRSYGRDYDGLLITRKMMIYGALMTLPLAIMEGNGFDPMLLLEPVNLFGILFLGLLGSCLCYILWAYSVKEIGVVKSNILLYIMPLVTIIAGHLVFNETITIFAMFGTALIIIGMLIANKHSVRSDIHPERNLATVQANVSLGDEEMTGSVRPLRNSSSRTFLPASSAVNPQLMRSITYNAADTVATALGSESLSNRHIRKWEKSGSPERPKRMS